MRVPNPTLVRVGSITSGAIVESGDGEIEVPAVLQPSFELSSPVGPLVVSDGLTPFRDSFVTGLSLFKIGAQVSTQPPVFVIGRGVWSIDIAFSGTFLGTSNLLAAPQDGLLLQGQGATTIQLALLPRLNGASVSWAKTFRFAIAAAQFETWLLVIQNGPTVALDQLAMNCFVVARKILG